MPRLDRVLLFSAFPLLAAAGTAFAAPANWQQLSRPWSEVTAAAPGPADSIGSYGAGCITGAEALPPDGPGFEVMRPSRHRNFGHPALIHFIEKLGKRISALEPGKLLIGDLGQPRGGPAPTGHKSHQIGLDADIWFAEATQRLSVAQRETMVAPEMVLPGAQSIDPSRWTPAQATVLKMVATDPQVDRVFVNPAIKRQLCEQTHDASWLRKLRPWWGHVSHFHVRLHCPAGDRQCKAQAPLPPGSGCDASLNWWFTSEAKAKLKESQAHPSLPVLPQACKAVLKE